MIRENVSYALISFIRFFFQKHWNLRYLGMLLVPSLSLLTLNSLPPKKKTCFYWILLLYHLIVFCFSLFIFGCVPVISHKENFQNFRWVPSSFQHPFKLTLMSLYLNKFNVMHCNPVFILKIFVQHVKLNEVFLRVWLAG